MSFEECSSLNSLNPSEMYESIACGIHTYECLCAGKDVNKNKFREISFLLEWNFVVVTKFMLGNIR